MSLFLSTSHLLNSNLDDQPLVASHFEKLHTLKKKCFKFVAKNQRTSKKIQSASNLGPTQCTSKNIFAYQHTRTLSKIKQLISIFIYRILTSNMLYLKKKDGESNFFQFLLRIPILTCKYEHVIMSQMDLTTMSLAFKFMWLNALALAPPEPLSGNLSFCENSLRYVTPQMCCIKVLLRSILMCLLK